MIPKNVQVISKAQALRSDVDSGDSSVEYVGFAQAGSSSASAVWKLIRYTDSGSSTVKEFADGDADYDNIYDDREGLSYS